jgi:hypothetical protein
MLVSVYEQNSTHRQSLLMTEFFKFQRDSQMGIAAYVARNEMQFSDMNTKLRRRGLHDIPIKLQHVQILATVKPEYQEFSNARESLDENNRTTNGLLEKFFSILNCCETLTTAAQCSKFVADKKNQ